MADFRICIGDWSSDGHGLSEYFIATSAKDISEIREAYFTAREKYPKLNPEKFCARADDASVPNSVVEAAKSLGLEIDPENFTSDEMAKYVAWFINLGDPSAQVEIVQPPPSIPALYFYGFDSKRRHIGFIGYGLYDY